MWHPIYFYVCISQSRASPSLRSAKHSVAEKRFRCRVCLVNVARAFIVCCCCSPNQQQSTQSHNVHAIDLCVSINYRQTNKLSVIFVCCDASEKRKRKLLTKIQRNGNIQANHFLYIHKKYVAMFNSAILSNPSFFLHWKHLMRKQNVPYAAHKSATRPPILFGRASEMDGERKKFSLKNDSDKTTSLPIRLSTLHYLAIFNACTLVFGL